MPPRRAIGERLRRAGSLKTRREVAHDWATNWMRDHEHTLAEIERALGGGNAQEAGRYLGQLKALNDKAMTALPRVIDALSDEPYVLCGSTFPIKALSS